MPFLWATYEEQKIFSQEPSFFFSFVALEWGMKNIFTKPFFFAPSREFRVRKIKKFENFRKMVHFLPLLVPYKWGTKNIFSKSLISAFSCEFRMRIKTFLRKGLTFDLSQEFGVGANSPVMKIMWIFLKNLEFLPFPWV